MTKNVLVMEADPTVRDLVILGLKREGFEVKSTQSEKIVIDLFNQKWPDIFLVDVLVNNINGIDLTKKVAKIDQLKHTKILMLSSLAFGEIAQQAMEAGASAFVVKPFSIQMLLNKIQEVTA